MSQAFHVPAGLYARLPGTCFPPQADRVLSLHRAFFSCCGRTPHSKSRKFDAERHLRSLPIEITCTLCATGCATGSFTSGCSTLLFSLLAGIRRGRSAVLQSRVRKSSPASPLPRRTRWKDRGKLRAIGARVASIQFAAQPRRTWRSIAEADRPRHATGDSVAAKLAIAAQVAGFKHLRQAVLESPACQRFAPAC